MSSHRRKPNAALTEADAIRIKESSEPTRNLARAYGVCVETIRRVRRGDSWYDAEPIPELDDATKWEIEKSLRTPKDIESVEIAKARLSKMLERDKELGVHKDAMEYFMNRDTKETHDDEHEAKQDDQVVSTKSGTGV